MMKVIDGIKEILDIGDLADKIQEINKIKKIQMNSVKDSIKDKKKNDQSMVKSLFRISKEKRNLELLEDKNKIESEAQRAVIEATQENLNAKKAEKQEAISSIKDWLKTV